MAKAIAVAEQTGGALQPKGSLTGYFGGIWQNTTTFLSDVRGEMRKVVTPSWPEVQSTTIVVLITVALFALYFYVLDQGPGQGIQWILRKLTGQQ
jgi:preprotein translocase subunit SecE